MVMRRILLILLCMALLATAKTPRPLANITIAPPPFGKAIQLSSYRGKVMVIAVFSTGCEACVTTIRYLDRLQKDYSGKPVVMIGGAADPGAVSLIRPFIDRYKITIPLGVLNEDDARRLTDSTPTQHLGVPALMFVDKKGIVQSQFPGDSPFFKAANKNTRLIIDSMLKQ